MGLAPVFLLVALLAGPASHVLETRLEASARGLHNSVDARLDVWIDASAAKRLRFQALEIQGTRIENLSVFVEDQPLPMRLDLSGRPLVRGEIELPPMRETARDRVVTFRYRVDQRDARSLTVPSIIVGDGQAAAREGAFSGRLLLREREGGDAVERFPSNGVRVEGESFDWKLPLVPAFVSVGAPAGKTEGEALFGPFREAGFSFWGLFAVSAAVVGLYLMWMIRCERRRSPS